MHALKVSCQCGDCPADLSDLILQLALVLGEIAHHVLDEVIGCFTFPHPATQCLGKQDLAALAITGSPPKLETSETTSKKTDKQLVQVICKFKLVFANAATTIFIQYVEKPWL